MLLDEKLRSYADVVTRIKAMKSWKAGQLKDLHELMDWRRDRYHLKHYPATEREEGEERVHLAAEMRLVDKAYGLLTVEKPSIKAYPEDETEPGLRESDWLESWLEGVSWEQSRRQGVNPFDLSTMDMLITSMACIFTYWDTSLDSRVNWQASELETAEYMQDFYGMEMEQPEPRLGELPIIIKRRDPRKVYAQEGGNQGRWKWVMYVDRILIADVESEWNVQLRDQREKDYRGKATRDIEVIDCWSWENDPETGEPILYNAVVAGKQLIKPPTPMRKYKHMPFEIFFCRTTPEPQWERKGLPITAQIEKVTGELEAAWNARMRSAKMHSQLPLTYQGPGPTPDVATGFGKVITLPPDSQFGFMEFRGMPPDYDSMTGMLHAEVEAGGLGAPIMGDTPASPSGYALALRGEAGTLNLVAPQQSLSLAMSNVLLLGRGVRARPRDAGDGPVREPAEGVCSDWRTVPRLLHRGRSQGAVPRGQGPEDGVGRTVCISAARDESLGWPHNHRGLGRTVCISAARDESLGWPHNHRGFHGLQELPANQRAEAAGDGRGG
jgi:hypothetical protein